MCSKPAARADTEELDRGTKRTREATFSVQQSSANVQTPTRNKKRVKRSPLLITAINPANARKGGSDIAAVQAASVPIVKDEKERACHTCNQ